MAAINSIIFDMTNNMNITKDIQQAIIQGQKNNIKIRLYFENEPFNYAWDVNNVFTRPDGSKSNNIPAVAKDGYFELTLRSWMTDIHGELKIATRIFISGEEYMAFDSVTLLVQESEMPSGDTITDTQYDAILGAVASKATQVEMDDTTGRVTDLEAEKVDRAGDTMSGDLDLDGNKLKNAKIDDGVADDDPVNKGQLDKKVDKTTYNNKVGLIDNELLRLENDKLDKSEYNGDKLLVDNELERLDNEKAKKPTNIGDANFDTLYLLTKNGIESGIKVGHVIEPNAVPKRGGSGHLYTPTAIEGTQATPKAQVESLISTHNTDQTAHLYIRQLIEALGGRVDGLEGMGRSLGEIDKTQVQLMEMNEGDRNAYISIYLGTKYTGYVAKNGDLIYTKTVATEIEHEWEFNGATWVDNGEWTIRKASNIVHGMVKGDGTYVNIVEGIIQVLLSDYATKVGSDIGYYDYTSIKAIDDELGNIYRKSEVYDKTTVNFLLDQIKAIYGWQDTYIGEYDSGNLTILENIASNYDHLIFVAKDGASGYLPMSALSVDEFFEFGGIKLTKQANGDYVFSDIGTFKVQVYGIKLEQQLAENIEYDNDGGGLTAENMQEAIDELAGKVEFETLTQLDVDNEAIEPMLVTGLLINNIKIDGGIF